MHADVRAMVKSTPTVVVQPVMVFAEDDFDAFVVGIICNARVANGDWDFIFTRRTGLVRDVYNAAGSVGAMIAIPGHGMKVVGMDVSENSVSRVLTGMGF